MSPEQPVSNPARVDRPEEGKVDGSATPLSSSSTIDRLTAELAEAREERKAQTARYLRLLSQAQADESRAESAESQLAALREAHERFKEAAQVAVSFMATVEWTSGENDATDARLGLEEALESALPSTPCPSCEGLREALAHYGEHYVACRLRINTEGSVENCTCGLSAAMASSRLPSRQEEGLKTI